LRAEADFPKRKTFLDRVSPLFSEWGNGLHFQSTFKILGKGEPAISIAIGPDFSGLEETNFSKKK